MEGDLTNKMKKILIIVAFLMPTLSLASIDVNLKYGSKGAEVIELQEYLIDKGFLQGPATGNFFILTKKAVIAYQASTKLPPTGFVGPMTREIINTDLMDDIEAETEETGGAIETIDTNNSSILQHQIDELLAQLDLLRQGQEKIVQNTEPTVPTGNPSLPSGNVVAEPIPVTKPDLKFYSVAFENKRIYLRTNFPLNPHSTKLVATQQTTGFTKTYSLDGQIIMAAKQTADDDAKSVYYEYEWNLNTPVSTYATSDSYFYAGGTAVMVLTSSDGDIVTSAPFVVNIPFNAAYVKF